MVSETSHRVAQPIYRLIAKRAYFTLSEAIWYLTAYALRHEAYEDREATDRAIRLYQDEIAEIVYRAILTNSLAADMRFHQVNGNNELDFCQTTVMTVAFVTWAKNHDLELPLEFCARLEGEVVSQGERASGVDGGPVHEAVAMDMVSEVAPPHVMQTAKEYQFQKTAKGWNIQFEDVVLRGVKDSLGLNYIRELLKNPGEWISVLKLQQLIGSIGPSDTSGHGHDCDGHDDGWQADGDHGHDGNGYDADGYDSQGYYDAERNAVENDYAGGIGADVMAWEPSDAAAINAYMKRMAELDEQLASARNGKVLNRSKIKRLEIEKTIIAKHLSESSYKPKDPELDKNRKKVTKNIMEARAKIERLEEANGYPGTPITKHFNLHIKTGSNCSYGASSDMLPEWMF